MNKLVTVLTVATAVSAAGLRAQEITDDFFADLEAEGGGTSTEGGSAVADEVVAADEGETAEKPADDEDDPIIRAANALSDKSKEKYFFILPFCRTLEGRAQVLTPGTNDWADVKEGKYYPLGTKYRTLGDDTTLCIKFGKEVEVDIKGEASFATRAQPLGEPSRTISLESGTITVKLPRNMPQENSLFVVTAPGFKATNLAGDSRYTYGMTGDGDEAKVRCVTGSMAIEGRHFKIASMRAANELKIRTSQDLLFTGLYGSRGDIPVRLEQGQVRIKDYETGEFKIEDRVLDWTLSPQTAVRIHRALPSIGDRMSVTIMTFDASGELKNRCAFAERCYQVNSGELGPTSKKERDAIAKRAAEATEAAEAMVGAEATEDASADEGGSGDDSSAADDDFEF